MAKSLSERIAARTVKKKPARSAQNRAAFLALRIDIKQALDDGWPVNVERSSSDKRIVMGFFDTIPFGNRER